MAKGDQVGRTPDGVRYHIEGDPDFSYSRDTAGMGELVRADGSVSEIIDEISRSVQGGLHASRASTAKVEFGIALTARSGFVVTRGTSDANIVVTLEYETLNREEHGHADQEF